MHVRYCVNCEQEFRPEILRCSDCGGDLEDRYEDEDAGLARGEVTAEVVDPHVIEPPPEYRLVFRGPDSASFKKAADALAAARIRFRGDGSAAGFQLLVPAEDLPAAAAALAGTEGSVLVNDEAQPFVGVEGGVCPACGTSVAAGLLDCPGCGLTVGAEPAQCESCGALLGPSDVHCPVCRPASG